MTLEEAIQEANSGNIDAMNQLGHYFRQEHEMAKALEWFRRSAEAGSIRGAFDALPIARQMAIASEDVDDDEAFSKWSLAFDLCQQILNSNEDGPLADLSKRVAADFFPEIIFGTGRTLYELKEYDAAKNVLEAAASQGAEPPKVVLGLCNARLHNYCEAYPLLRPVETEEIEGLSIKYHFLALIMLSNIYRYASDMRIPGIATDVERAYQCVQKASALPGLPDAVRESAYQELGKYRKSFLGGYTYKE